MHFEHLIDGKKPDARVVFAMFACHLFATLRLASRNALVLLVHKHALIRVCWRWDSTRLLFVDMMDNSSEHVRLIVTVEVDLMVGASAWKGVRWGIGGCLSLGH